MNDKIFLENIMKIIEFLEKDGCSKHINCQTCPMHYNGTDSDCLISQMKKNIKETIDK